MNNCFDTHGKAGANTRLTGMPGVVEFSFDLLRGRLNGPMKLIEAFVHHVQTGPVDPILPIGGP